MTLQVWSGVAEVRADLPGPGRIELYAVKRAGGAAPILVVEVYDAETLVAGGEVAVWELNQAIAALLSETVQARRLGIRDDGRGHGGYLDVIADGEDVQVVGTSRDGAVRVEFATTAKAFVADLNRLVRHYLGLTRSTSTERTIVLPDAVSPLLARR